MKSLIGKIKVKCYIKYLRLSGKNNQRWVYFYSKTDWWWALPRSGRWRIWNSLVLCKFQWEIIEEQVEEIKKESSSTYLFWFFMSVLFFLLPFNLNWKLLKFVHVCFEFFNLELSEFKLFIVKRALSRFLFRLCVSFSFTWIDLTRSFTFVSDSFCALSYFFLSCLMEASSSTF